MAGAIGIVFGLCVLSFTLGAALMYVVLRRREDAAAPSSSSSASDQPVERTWVEKPPLVEPVDEDYDTRPIHRNPVMGLPQLEPALAVPAEPVAEPESVAEPEPVPAAEPETVGAVGYDRDGDLAPPLGEVEAPEPIVEADTDSLESAAEAEKAAEAEVADEAEELAELDAVAEPELEAVAEPEPEPEPVAVAEPEPAAETVVAPALPPPAVPQPVEHTTWVEREDFRQRYLRTFEEVRRKAGSN